MPARVTDLPDVEGMRGAAEEGRCGSVATGRARVASDGESERSRAPRRDVQGPLRGADDGEDVMEELNPGGGGGDEEGGGAAATPEGEEGGLDISFRNGIEVCLVKVDAPVYSIVVWNGNSGLELTE